MIADFYKKIIVQIGFTEDKIFKNDLKNEIFVVSGTIKKQKCLLKICSLRNSQKADMFKKEKYLSDFFCSEFSDKKFNFTEIIDMDESDGYLWLTRKFYKGKSLSDYKVGIPLMGYDVINNFRFLNHKKIISKLIDQHQKLESIKKPEYLNYFKSEPKRRYKDLELYPIDQVSSYFNFALDKQLEFYRQTKESYYQRESLQSCDLVPGNILIIKNGDIMISDLEFLCFENNMLDYACLWLYLWRYPKWQNHLTDQIIKTDDDRIDFVIGIIRITIACFGHKIENNLDLAGYKNHIWTRYLQSAGESYEKLIKTR